jgi:hypothetical protein
MALAFFLCTVSLARERASTQEEIAFKALEGDPQILDLISKF